MSLRRKLTLLVVGLTTLLLGGLAAVVVGSVEHWATKVVDDELSRRADVLEHEVRVEDGQLRLDDDDDLGHRGLPFVLESGSGRALLTSELPFPAVTPRGMGFSTEETARGERLRVLSVEVQPRHSGEPLVLRVAAPLSVVSRITERVRLGFLVAFVIATLLGAAGAALIAHGVLSPMRRLSGELEALDPHDTRGRLDPRGLGPELGGLALAFNGLLARVAAVFDGQRAFVGRASHALKTPLASILMEAEVALRKDRDAASYRATLEAIAAITRDASQLAEGLLALTRADAAVAAPKEDIDLVSFAREVQRMAEPRCQAKPLRFELEVEPGLVLHATKGRLRELVDALVDNALRYTPAGGTVWLAARRAQDRVVIEVSDSGPGFAPEERAQVFERFFRGRAAEATGQPGSGLGLAVVKALADAEGAEVTIGDRTGGGAVVGLTFQRPGLPSPRPSPPRGEGDRG